MQRDELQKRFRPFRWRVQTVLLWRYAAIGGAIGTAFALFADIGDWRNVWTIEPLTLVAFIVAGIAFGIFYALWRPLPTEAIAQLIDRRAKLKDRVTTALLCGENVFAEPLHEDAVRHLASVRPSQVFRFRLTAWHGVFGLLLIALLVSHFIPLLPLPFTESLRQDRKEAKKMVEQVKRVLKPVVERSKKPEASKLEKRMAQQLRELDRRAKKGRLSKKEAMVKLNKLLSEVRKLEEKARKEVKLVSMKALTAAETMKQTLPQRLLAAQMREMQSLMERMQEIEKQLQSGKNLQGKPLSEAERKALQDELEMLKRTMDLMGQMESSALERHIQALQQQISNLQQTLQLRQLSEEMRKLLEQQLQSLQQQLRALRLSKEAQEFLSKLFSDPNFQEAMKRLAELQKKLGQMMQGEMPQLSPEELEKMLQELEKTLEEMAKKYGSDEAIRKLAQEILEAVKKLKELKEGFG